MAQSEMDFRMWSVFPFGSQSELRTLRWQRLVVVGYRVLGNTEVLVSDRVSVEGVGLGARTGLVRANTGPLACTAAVMRREYQREVLRG